jgi:hypothetical protein
MNTVILHRPDTTNPGDYYSNPSLYFDLGNVSIHDIKDPRSVNKIKDNTNLIIGGGGLVRHRKFDQRIIEAVEQKSRFNSLILWGAGHNYRPKEETENWHNPYYLDLFDAVGIRDYYYERRDNWVPCASCMHPIFDENFKITNDTVYYVHQMNKKIRENSLTDVTYKYNNIDFESAIEFLGSSRKIVTDSYHGAYWGMLLGKDVTVVSWSTKFDYFKHPVHKLYKYNSHKIKPSNTYRVLDEYRQANINFYKKVKLAMKL